MSCSGSSPQNCLTCLSCTSAGYYWYQPSGTNCASGGSCVGSTSSMQCTSYGGPVRFTVDSSACSGCNMQGCLTQYSGNRNCNSNYNSGSCFNDYNDGAYQQAVNALIGGLVTFFVLWIINMVAIGVVTRRRGLNPAVYVALAFFCGVFAWICVACSQPQQSVVVVTSSGTPMGQVAPNSYPAPNPYGQQPAPNPYSQPAPNPYSQPAPNPYSQPAPSPHGQPAPNPYGQPSDAPNPYGGDLVKPQ
jgi:hypothetical protein